MLWGPHTSRVGSVSEPSLTSTTICVRRTDAGPHATASAAGSGGSRAASTLGVGSVCTCVVMSVDVLRGRLALRVATGGGGRPQGAGRPHGGERGEPSAGSRGAAAAAAAAENQHPDEGGKRKRPKDDDKHGGGGGKRKNNQHGYERAEDGGHDEKRRDGKSRGNDRRGDMKVHRHDGGWDDKRSVQKVEKKHKHKR